jgi:antirestriction protein
MIEKEIGMERIVRRDACACVPRVWVGCQRCYDNGVLTGVWCDAVDAGSLTSVRVHQGRRLAGHEVLACFDVENIPVHQVLTIPGAVRWAETLLSVDDSKRPALLAWIDLRYGDISEDEPVPDVAMFDEAFCGVWEDFAHFASQLADDTGMLASVPVGVGDYFDWDTWTRDLALDYMTSDALDGVYVFRCL